VGQDKPPMSRGLLKRLMGGNPVSKGLSSQQSHQSFAERQKIDKNRQLIRSYRDSKLGQQTSMKPNSVDLKSDELIADARSAEKTPPKRIETGQNRPSAGFQEPPSRRYNPYD